MKTQVPATSPAAIEPVVKRKHPKSTAPKQQDNLYEPIQTIPIHTSGWVFLEDRSKVIFECVDSTLTSLGFIDKQSFYRMLEQSYGVKPQDIGKNFDDFHNALKRTLGIRHFKVERVLLRTLKQRHKNGLYSHAAEIDAFCAMAEVFMKDTREQVRTVKRIMSMEKYAKGLEERIKESEAKLKTASRMATIGETAAMVGHDIRNPLQSIMGDLYLLREIQEDMPNGRRKQAIRECVDSISESTDYISKIITDLQDFARPLHPQYDDIEPSELVENVFKTIAVPSNITLKLDTKADLKLKTDPTFIRRALTNLVKNAIEAMPEGGVLTVSISVLRNSALITVEDTGKGIPEEAKSNLFKPLFTTKAKGQGMGLAVTKRLIDAAKGKISYESQEGKGTKFVIRLPLQLTISET